MRGGVGILNMEIGNVMHNGNHFYRFPDARDPRCLAPPAPMKKDIRWMKTEYQS